MHSVFSEYEELVSDQADEVFGEDIRIVYTKAGGMTARQADESRQPFDTIGAVFLNPIVASPSDKGQYDGLQPVAASDRVHIDILDSHFGENPFPKKGDIVKLIGRAAGQEPPAQVVVRDVQPDGEGRSVLVCSYR